MAESRSSATISSTPAPRSGLESLTLVVVLIAHRRRRRDARRPRVQFQARADGQYWYFGAPPNRFLARWGDVPRMLHDDSAHSARALARLRRGRHLHAARLWREGEHRNGTRSSSPFSCSRSTESSRALRCSGRTSHAYVQPLLRVLLLLGAVALDRRFHAARRCGSAGVRRFGVGGLGPRRLPPRRRVVMFVLVPSMFATTFVTLPHLVRDHLIDGKGAVYSGIWPETITGGQAILDAHRNPDGHAPHSGRRTPGFSRHATGSFIRRSTTSSTRSGPRIEQGTSTISSRLRSRSSCRPSRRSYTQYEPWIEIDELGLLRRVAEELSSHRRHAVVALLGATTNAGAGPQEVWSADVSAGATSVVSPGRSR